jgi:hypothetical protein
MNRYDPNSFLPVRPQFLPGHVARQVKEQLEEYRREHLLPDTATLEKVMRYEGHLSRQFHRDLHELQRLQAMRQGRPLAAPVAIDVDIDTGIRDGMGSTDS